MTALAGTCSATWSDFEVYLKCLISTDKASHSVLGGRYTVSLF